MGKTAAHGVARIPRKGTKRMAAVNAAFEAAAERAIVALGAELDAERTALFGSRYFRIATRAGSLMLRADASSLQAGGTLICIFEDAERATALLNPSRASYGDLNTHTGKWHLYMFGEMDSAEIERMVSAHIRRAL